MFNNKKNFNPVKPYDYTGFGIRGGIGFSNGEQSWDESYDLLETLHHLLLEEGISHQINHDWITLDNADCRINGIDWEPGEEQLIKYAATWPDRGFEMRKQYVVFCTNYI